jgi:predicted esterase
MTRRQFAAGAVATVICRPALGRAAEHARTVEQESAGRLSARPQSRGTTKLASGPLGLEAGGRDGVIQLPSRMPAGKLPLLVFLHGATGNGASSLRRIGPAADQAGVVVLAPDSRNGTWDAIRDSFGDDVRFLNRALEFVFARLDVEPTRVAVGGFSDGATYALSLGLANGDLFPRIIACSPGFVVDAPAHGRARIFVSHGRSDQVLPIDQCSRRIVPRLKSRGYDVAYREFDGRHELPAEIAGEALEWLTSR